jgi:hypothetical protein
MHPPRLGNAPERLIWTRRLPDTALNERRVIDRNLRVGEPVLTDCDQPKIFVSAHSRRYARRGWVPPVGSAPSRSGLSERAVMTATARAPCWAADCPAAAGSPRQSR